MTLLRIKALQPDPDTERAMLVLEAQGAPLGLAFVVPMNEARRLGRVLGFEPCRCVPIYELTLECARRLGASLVRTVLDAEPDGIYATLVLHRDGVELAFRCHPADAIALALRRGAPIYATPAAMAHACPLDAGWSATDEPEIARWLDSVTPDDFSLPDGPEP